MPEWYSYPMELSVTIGLIILNLLVGFLSGPINRGLGYVLLSLAALVQVGAILSTFMSFYGAILGVASLGFTYLHASTIRDRGEGNSKATRRRAILIVLGASIYYLAVTWQLYYFNEPFQSMIYITAISLVMSTAATLRSDHTFENCSIHLKRPFFRPLPAKVGKVAGAGLTNARRA